jgi:hypothetical protein
MRGRPDPDDVRELVRGCAAGDGAARRAFQDRFGEDVYNFPVKIYGVSAERAADFYVYVFEADRIFTRMRTFEGRNGIQFRTFPRVLRAAEPLHRVAAGKPRARHRLAGRRRAGGRVAEPIPEADADVTAAWEGLSPEERLDLKLLRSSSTRWRRTTCASWRGYPGDLSRKPSRSWPRSRRGSERGTSSWRVSGTSSTRSGAGSCCAGGSCKKTENGCVLWDRTVDRPTHSA